MRKTFRMGGYAVSWYGHTVVLIATSEESARLQAQSLVAAGGYKYPRLNYVTVVCHV